MTASLPLRWAGGKRRQAARLAEILPIPPGHRYIEPFFGGGASYFHRVASGELDPKNAFLSDANAPLMNFWMWVQTDPERVIDHGIEFFPPFDKANYLILRGEWNAGIRHHPTVEAAAYFYWLNRAGYNGLWRENAVGQLNTPVGDRFRWNATALRQASLHLQGATLRCLPFDSDHFLHTDPSVVYCDPPYAPLAKGKDFTSYTAGGFSWKDHQRLAQAARYAGARGVQVAISNHDTPEVRELYAGAAQLVPLEASRSIRPGTARAKEIVAVFGGEA